MSSFDLVLCFCAALGITLGIILFVYMQYRFKKMWEGVK